MQTWGVQGVFLMAMALIGVWLMVTIRMRGPRYVSSLCVSVDADFTAVQDVLALPGVAEANHAPHQKLLYLKVDKHHFQRTLLDNLLSKD